MRNTCGHRPRSAESVVEQKTVRAGNAPAAPAARARLAESDLAVRALFGGAAGMRDRAEICRTDALRVAPERARSERELARLPCRTTRGQLRVRQLHRDEPAIGVDRDDVPV